MKKETQQFLIKTIARYDSAAESEAHNARNAKTEKAANTALEIMQAAGSLRDHAVQTLAATLTDQHIYKVALYWSDEPASDPSAMPKETTYQIATSPHDALSAHTIAECSDAGEIGDIIVTKLS
jgi:hypothetical protein